MLLRFFAWSGALVRVMPRPIACALAAAAGEIAFALSPRLRRVTVVQMRGVLGREAPPARVRAAARCNVRTAALYYADMVYTPRLDTRRLAFVDVDPMDGIENLVKAHRSGTGVIGASFHFGSPEFVAQSLKHWGIVFMAMIEPLDPPELTALFRSWRESRGHSFVPADRSGLRKAIRHLKKGEVLAVMVDRDIQHSGIDITLFGRPARVPTGAVELALATGCQIVPYLTYRRGLTGYRAKLFPAFELRRTGDKAADIRHNAERLAQFFEPYVREEPGQWFVLSEPVFRP